MDPLSAVQQFVAAINARDAGPLKELMTDDHRFVDATGTVHPGREQMYTGWLKFFATFPDYHIEIESTLLAGDVVAAFGWVSGSYHGDPEKAWKFPAAFRAVVKDGKIAEWRVYADIEPMARSMAFDRFGQAKPAAQ